ERIRAEVAQAASARVAQALMELVPAGAVVGGYVPHRGELDVFPALEALAARGHSVCLPGIEDNDKPLFFRRWRVGEKLAPGRYGIAVPEMGSPILRPDVLLVPLIAFDRSGHRLGYGAGYYDRTLAQMRSRESGVLAVGVAYAQQEVESLPADEHDERMDAIVTEKETIKVLA
ncbi:MAG: 5-formyltetrahydrofolate cyclo-ligase, partial [Rickettsiales bacterium]|nr:5-formyltetrahydrofolate cyclo-ligase [Rickettsiales bacterium]